MAGINGYTVEPFFFDKGQPVQKERTFYLTDGGKDNGNICRIKDVIISINIDTCKTIVNIPDAYTNEPFIAELNGLGSLKKFLDEVSEWLGYKETWRKISNKGKTFTILVIDNNSLLEKRTYFEGCVSIEEDF